MKSTMEILTKLQENSQKNHDEIFTRLYRYLLRPDIYFIAYQHLYSNKGAGTKGVNDDTADGFSEQYVTAIIEALRTGSYEPKPVRRTYIQKKNGKLRPLGLPVFADKLVQEAIRMILEAIYEPIFSIYSHGFRPGRSCHTALAMIKHEFTGAKWFIEGDIKGCFDNIDHPTLIGVLNRKIKDARFLNLIRMFLKASYMEDWNFHETYSGCPQGGIISPILANIYLNELDRYITQLKKEFDHGYNPRNFTEEYNTIRHKRDALHEKIKKAEGTMREQLIAQHKQLTKQLFRTPAKACTDKRLKYVRYADDFLIAINGTREECEEIKAKLTDFVRDTLKMELSQEKTLNIRFDSFKNEHQIVLRGELSYPVPLGDDPRGNIVRLDNAIGNFADRIADAEAALDSLEQQKQAAEVEIAKPFAQEEELQTKSARLAELDALLNMEHQSSRTEPEAEEKPDARPSVLAALEEKADKVEPVRPFKSYLDKDGDAR